MINTLAAEWFDPNSWYHIIFQTLDGINNFLLTIIGLAFFAQIIFMFLFFLKKKKFKKAKKLNRFAILIPARNEAEVIGNTVKKLRENTTYPQELFDIFVVADNCTDNTAEIAREAGAIVFERFDDNPKHRRASYPMQYGYQKILELKKYDAVIKFDADNETNPEYIEKMNDAFESGVKIARAYENSTNISQNIWTKISGLYYLRDSRFTNRVREQLHLDVMLSGAGLMVATEVLEKIDGWDCMSLSDDSEFTMKRMMEGYRIHYVEDAVVFEDQPSTFRDTVSRNMRMAKGLWYVFWHEGVKAVFKYLKDFRISYLDLFLQLFFIPIAVLCCTWIPLFYAYQALYILFVTHDFTYLTNVWTIIGYSLLFAFYLSFVVQGLVIIMFEYKKIRIRSRWQMIPSVFVFPFFMIIYCVAIFLGVVSNPKWKKVQRNVITENNLVDQKLYVEYKAGEDKRVYFPPYIYFKRKKLPTETGASILKDFKTNKVNLDATYTEKLRNLTIEFTNKGYNLKQEFDTKIQNNPEYTKRFNAEYKYQIKKMKEDFAHNKKQNKMQKKIDKKNITYDYYTKVVHEYLKK